MAAMTSTPNEQAPSRMRRGSAAMPAKRSRPRAAGTCSILSIIMRLIVTQPGEDAQALKAKLELGHDVIVIAAADDRAAAQDMEIPTDSYQLMPSPAPMRCAVSPATPQLDRLRHCRSWRSARNRLMAARQAGFARITEAGGDGVGLARHIIETCKAAKRARCSIFRAATRRATLPASSNALISR